MSRFFIGLLLLLLVGIRGAVAVPQKTALRPHLALQIGHNLPVTTVAFSPDGRLLASGSRDNTIKIWDATNGALRRTLSGQKGAISDVAFSPDSQVLASTGNDGNIRLWNVKNGAMLHTLRGHEYPTTSVAFSPDGKLVADGSFDSTIKVWDVRKRVVLRTLKGHDRSIASVAFSPDGKLLASASADRTIKLWNVPTGTVAGTLRGYGYAISSITFSSDGKLLASGSGGGVVRLWNVASRTVRRTMIRREAMMLSVAFSPDNKQLVCCDWDGNIEVLEATTGAVRHFLKEQKADAVAFSPTGRQFASGSRDKTITLWDADTGNERHVLKGHQNLVSSLAFSPDGLTLANGSWDQTVRLWDINTGALRRTLTGDDSQVDAVKYSPDGKLIASRSWDRTIQLWDAATGVSYRVLKGHTSWVNSISFSPDSKMLASGSEDKSIKVWDVATGGVLHTIPLEEEVQLVVFSRDGQTMASVTPDKIIRLWDVANGTECQTFRGHQGSVTSVEFSPDGKILASGSADGTVRLWDAATGKLLRMMLVRIGVATSMAFSPDGKTLASVGVNEITLWDVATGQARRVLLGHENLVLAVAFSPDGKRLASGSWDTTIKIWDPVSGRMLATLLTLPEVAEETLKARPLSIGAKALSIGAKALSIGAKAADLSGEWFITTPEGWFDCSANAARFIRWNVGTENVPAERYYRRLRRPDLVRQALRGEAMPSPDLTQQDIPPIAQFVRLQYDGEKQGTKSVTVTLEAQGHRDFKEVILLVNGRPLPPEQEKPVEIHDVPVALTARPLDIGAKPLSIGAKALSIGAKPLSIGAKPVNSSGVSTRSPYTLAKCYIFRVPLPLGASEVRLRALVYDAADLGSDPTEIRLNSPDTKPVRGNLYILCAGIGHYKNGSDNQPSIATGFSNLKFPDEDAQSIAARLHREGLPLYEKVEIFNNSPLLNEQATLENLRRGLKWLQDKGRPGQIDTVIVFLSGHGLSDPAGRYYFPTYEFDKQNWKNTSLSGRELQEALGSKLRARAVFLFADTCHSGALAGARSDDLNFEVNNSGVYMLASSSATQYSYESDKWGHGAFTLALLNTLSRPELAENGNIHFNVLTYAVPDEISKLMREAGQNENAMAPVVPLDGRRLDEPVAQVR